MIYETNTTLGADDVLKAAREFFTKRVPQYSAFVDKQGPTYVVLRGQGTEEVAIAVMAGEGGTRVRASSMLFDQQIKRFFSTLPVAA